MILMKSNILQKYLTESCCSSWTLLVKHFSNVTLFDEFSSNFSHQVQTPDVNGYFSYHTVFTLLQKGYGSNGGDQLLVDNERRQFVV